MTVASLELSKELFELSGWDGLYKDGLTDDTRNLQRKADGLFPLYNLSYLLRKLPARISPNRFGATKALDLTIVKQWDDEEYAFFYYNRKEIVLNCTDLSPASAAAKLCISLIKENILTREKS